MNKASSALVGIILGSLLGACGGGGSSPLPDKQLTQAITTGIDNIAAKAPSQKVFIGAYATAEGSSVGYWPASSELEVAKKIAAAIQGDPVKYAALYVLLINGGVHIKVLGDVMTSALGIVSSNDTTYVAKLTNSGLIVS